jgi:chromosome segregation ATPase
VTAERNDLSRRVEATDATVKEELNRLTSERDRLAHSGEDGHAAVGALTQQLAQREAELSKDRFELNRIAAERDHLFTTIRDIQPAVAVLKEELAKRKLECDQLSSVRDSLQDTLHQMRSNHAGELEAALADRVRAEARFRDAEEGASQKHALQHQAIQHQQDALANQMAEWKTRYQRLEAERNGLQVSLQDLQVQQADLRKNAAAQRDAFELMELQIEDADAARVEAGAERDRLKNILAEALAQYQNIPAAASTRKERI